jgi:alpha-aminoadipic semialdehyde synthase
MLRETYNPWERRAPLTPPQVQDFLQAHVHSQFLVQASQHRIFSNEAYQQAGATIVTHTIDLAPADVILGVKRPKCQEYSDLPSQTCYLFFSHVLKGQPENMTLLQRMLDQQNTLMDYECIVDDSTTTTTTTTTASNRRLVAFGKYAGLAGMMDTFSLLGRRLLQTQGVATPFLNCPPTVYHKTLEEGKASVQQLGARIQQEGLCMELPLVVCMTGGPNGNVHQGVKDIFQQLPHEMVAVDDLPEVLQQQQQQQQQDGGGGTYYKVYGVAPEHADLYQRNDGNAFERSDFFQNPHLYSCTFADKIAPYCHVLMNGLYWDYRFPRLLTKQDMLRLVESGKNR